MEKKRRLKFAGALMLWMLLLTHYTFAIGPNTTFFRTVETVSNGCTAVAVDGKYVEDAVSALKRINEIRLEACSEGVPDPRNSSRALTPADYVPIRWSADLEYIARVRAAESSLVVSHTRPNGKSCFSVQSPGGVSSYGEVLAFNSSSDVVDGINQWYREKSAWINRTPKAVTGHYTQMINPSHTYVGIGCFRSEDGIFKNTTAGEFAIESGLNEAQAASIPDCRVIIEIKKSSLSAPELVLTGEKMRDSGILDRGDELTYALGMDSNLEGYIATVYDAGNISWRSSNVSVASVDSYGNVKVNGVGTARITAVSDSGLSAGVDLSPAHIPGSRIVEKKATRFEDGKYTQKCSQCGDDMGERTIPRIGKVSLSRTQFTFDGKAHKPEVKAFDALGSPIKAKVSYNNNTNIGEGTAVVSFKGDYDDSLRLDFSIVPGKVSGLKVKAGKKNILVSWQKAGFKKGGYEIQYSLNRTFAKSRMVQIKKIGTTSRKISKLKGNKRYYVRIRTYAVVNGKKYVSAWSGVKKCKTIK